MQITSIFKKKDKQPETSSEIRKETENAPLRDEKGRFIGKKKEEKKETAKREEKPQIISVTFFGKEVRKVYSQGKWYFNIGDIHNLSYPKTEGEKVTVSEKYEKIKKQISHNFEGEEYATAEEIKELVEEINGLFPGPLTRWLYESASMEYIPIPEPEPKIEK